jgi:hypothetical protein
LRTADVQETYVGVPKPIAEALYRVVDVPDAVPLRQINHDYKGLCWSSLSKAMSKKKQPRRHSRPRNLAQANTRWKVEKEKKEGNEVWRAVDVGRAAKRGAMAVSQTTVL